MTDQTTTLSDSERFTISTAIRRKLRDIAPQLLEPGNAAAPGGIDNLDQRLDVLVGIVRQVTANRIEPYLYSILTDICAHCAHESPNGSCPLRESEQCVLFAQTRAIVEAIYEVLQANDGVPAVAGAELSDDVRKEIRMFKRILVAVDASVPAFRAVSAASKLATDLGAKVRLVHVVHPPVPFSPASIPTALETEANMIAASRETLRGLHSEFSSGVEVDDTVLEGHPADRIVDEAAAWKADLIIVGDRDRRSFTRFVLGSTADAVVRQAPCPVLVVRQTVSGASPEKAVTVATRAGAVGQS